MNIKKIDVAKFFILTITSVFSAKTCKNKRKYEIILDPLDTESFGGMSLKIKPISISRQNETTTQQHEIKSSLMEQYDSLSKIYITISYREKNQIIEKQRYYTLCKSYKFDHYLLYKLKLEEINKIKINCDVKIQITNREDNRIKLIQVKKNDTKFTKKGSNTIVVVDLGGGTNIKIQFDSRLAFNLVEILIEIDMSNENFELINISFKHQN